MTTPPTDQTSASASDELRAAAKRISKAQIRMLDRWADGDDMVKRELWSELHEAGNELSAALASVPPMPTAEITQANVAYRDTELTEEDVRLWQKAKAEGRGKLKFTPPLPTAADVESRVHDREQLCSFAVKCMMYGRYHGTTNGFDEKAYEFADEFLAAIRSEAERMAAEVERLRNGCNPTCPRCGLKPCNESGEATLWCDECVSALTADRDRIAAELRQAREALKPFADVLKGNYSHQGDNFFIVAGSGPSDLRFTFNLSQFRKATAALAAAGQSSKPQA